uniref:Uncharacterized protein n=1 Tax=Rhizochromulina marina TaxID=1034831 RepID=A0A7S2WJM3_9STRA|mmetsp:Transcript_25563/g.74592  ORF Transcript_25563/g.74592 Transcript_25563/m.74592 type:complete len:930 (+) Transcript_25563:110-2899(+)
MAPKKRPTRPESSGRSQRRPQAEVKVSKDKAPGKEGEAPAPWESKEARDLPLLDQVQELVGKQKELMALELEEAQDKALHWKRQFEQLAATAATLQQAKGQPERGMAVHSAVGHPLSHRELLRLPLDTAILKILKGLEHLDLSDEPLKAKDLEAAIKRLPRLHRSPRLSLARAGLTDDLARTLQKLLEYSFIKVDLSSNNLGAIGLAAVLTALPRRASVTELNLEDNQPLASTPLVGERLGNFLMDAYRYAPNLCSLRVTLDDYNSPGAAAAAKAKGGAKRRGKSPLNAVQFVRMLRRADTLTLSNLGLVGARLSLETIKQLSSLLGERPGQSLTNLDLSFAFIGFAGATALASALRRPGCPLAGLQLPHNGLGSGGTEAICEALLKSRNETLTTLNVRANQITDSGAEALRRLVLASTTLTFLELGDNDLGSRASAQLASTIVESVSLCHVRGLTCSAAQGAKVEAHLCETSKGLQAGAPFLEDAEEKALDSANGTTTSDNFMEAYHFVVPTPPKAGHGVKLVVECELSRKDAGLFIWRIVRQRNSPSRAVDSRRVLLTGGAEGASGWMPRGRTLLLRAALGLGNLAMEEPVEGLEEEKMEAPSRRTKRKPRKPKPDVFLEADSEEEETGPVDEGSARGWILSVEVQACDEGYKALSAKEIEQANSYIVRNLRVSWCSAGLISAPFVGNQPFLFPEQPGNQQRLSRAAEAGLFNQSFVNADRASMAAEREFIGSALGLSSTTEWTCLRRVFLPRAAASIGANLSLRLSPVSASTARTLAGVEWCLVLSSPFTMEHQVLGNGDLAFVEAVKALAKPDAPRLWRWNRLDLDPSHVSTSSEAGDNVSLWVCPYNDQRQPVVSSEVVIDVQDFHLEYPDYFADLPAIEQGPVHLQDPLALAQKSTAEMHFVMDFDRNPFPMAMSSVSRLMWQ